MLPIRAFQQTTSYTCGPAALVTLSRHYDRPGDELAIADEAKCTPDKGTSPEHMVAWLEEHGFEVTWGEHGTLDLLRSNLERGVPTLVEWIDYGGHWVLVVGYDTKGTENPRDDVIHFADPADGHDDTRDGLTSFNAVRFDAMWFDAFLFERPMFKIYITATPAE
jgi:ABC-type bacteriocin/lantibiotic exporter with double-glycine peptidase domain